MNRHDRRRARRAAENNKLYEQMQQASHGVSRTFVVRTHVLLRLVRTTPLGKALLAAAMQWHRQMENPDNWPSDRPACACCDRVVAAWCPAVVIQLPGMAEQVTDQCIGTGVCDTCASLSDDEIIALTAASFGGWTLQTGNG